MGLEVERVKGKTELLSSVQELRTVAAKEENVSLLLSNSDNKPRVAEKVSADTNKEDSNFFLKHPVLSICGGLLLGAVMYSIGRNPKSLAKFIKGTSKPINSKYAEAEKLADEIFAAAKSGKNPKLTAKLEEALQMFKKPEYRCDMSKGIARLEELIKEKSIFGGEFSTALSELKKKVRIYFDKYEKGLLGSKIDNPYQLGEIFYKENAELIKRINSTAEKLKINSWLDEASALSESRITDQIARLEQKLSKQITATEKLSGPLAELKKKLNLYLDKLEQDIIAGKAGDSINPCKEFYNTNKELIEKVNDLIVDCGEYFTFDRYSAAFQSYIRSCPKEFLSKDGIYFHGTTKGKPIYENGLSPLCSNQDAQRELGAAIYTTPDVRVAGCFSQPWGTILPVKLAPDAKVAFVDEVMFTAPCNRAYQLVSEYLEQVKPQKFSDKSQLLECLIRKLYMEAGYDAAYMPKAMKSGLLSLLEPDVNKVLGRPQSQLGVFNGEKLEIIDRNLLQRISDVWAKLATFGNMLKFSLSKS